MTGRRKVLVESPYSGDVEANVAYARRCVRDCVLRGEAPIASHLLLTQPGILNDDDPSERQDGMECGWAWLEVCDAVVIYTDRGISRGMLAGIERATDLARPIEYRKLEEA